MLKSRRANTARSYSGSVYSKGHIPGVIKFCWPNLVEDTSVALPHTRTSSTLRWTQSVANVVRPHTLSGTGCKNAPQQQHNDVASSVQLTRRFPSMCRSHTRRSCRRGKLSCDTGVSHSSSSISSYHCVTIRYQRLNVRYDNAMHKSAC